MLSEGLHQWSYPRKEIAPAMIVTVPLCHLPNSKVQTFEVRTMLRSLFQIEYLAQVSRSPTFAYFVTVTHKGKELIIHEDVDGELDLMWYTKDGSLNLAKLSRKEVLLKTTVPGKVPLSDADHPSYLLKD